MNAPGPGRDRVARGLPWLLFPLSGAAGLGWQLVWTRSFTLGLGHELSALLGVVTAFLGGLAAGNWLADHPRFARCNPARVYAALECLAGVWGLLSSWLIPRANDWMLGLIGLAPSALSHALLAFLCPALLLLPATVALGGTFPAMERWRAAATPDARVVGFVYGLNTLGAFAGTLGTAFILMPALGLRMSSVVLGGINLACATLAWRSKQPADGQKSSTCGVRPSSAAATRVGPQNSLRPRTGALLLGTGLLGIGYELAAVRALSQVLENTVFTFAAVLAVYLLGTAIGAALYQRALRPLPQRALLAVLLGATATACVAGTWLTGFSGGIYARAREGLGDAPGAVALAEMLAAAAVIGPAVVCMGMTFSLLVQSARHAQGGVGRAAALNLLGGALAGPVITWLLLPAAGLKWTLLLIAATYVLLGAVQSLKQLPSLPRWPAWTRIAIAVPLLLILGFAVRLPSDLHLVKVPPGGRLIAHREGRLATVAVIETPDGHRSLRVNNRFQMGGTAATLAQRRQAEIPLLLHPRPERALFLGPGTGITLGAAAGHPGLMSDAVELVPEIIELMPWFEPHNRSAHRAPNVRLHSADARRFTRMTDQTYDVIVADLFHPGLDGAGALYTREHFATLRQRLAPNGLLCQWLPLHQLDAPTAQLIFRAFLDVFPEAQGWLLHFNVDIPVLGLIGAAEPLRLTHDWIERRLAADNSLRDQARAVGLGTTLNLLGCHLAGPAALRAFAGAGPMNTDDRPRVMFRAPRHTARPAARPEALLLELLARCRAQPGDVLAADSPATATAFTTNLVAFVEARDLYLRGLVIEGEGRVIEAFEQYLQAAGRSLHFTPAYARCVTIIQAMAQADRAAARRLFARLEAAQPNQPLGRQLLGPLLDTPAVQ